MKRFIWVVLATMLTSVQMTAAPLTASQLYDACAMPAGTTGDSICSSYINGFAAGMLATQLANKGKPVTCLPTDITGTQARLIIEKRMQAVPEQLNKGAMTFLMDTFQAVFPCAE